jgi:hypothetical protein
MSKLGQVLAGIKLVEKEKIKVRGAVFTQRWQDEKEVIEACLRTGQCKVRPPGQPALRNVVAELSMVLQLDHDKIYEDARRLGDLLQAGRRQTKRSSLPGQSGGVS